MSNYPLDAHDEMPRYMKKYISNYGWHFNKAAYEYAVSFMYKKNVRTMKEESVQAYTKEQVDELLKVNNVDIKTKIMYDYVYVATMCKADYEKAIQDDLHLAYFIKETIDDVDVSKETTFRRWVATMIGNGIPIDWEELC